MVVEKGVNSENDRLRSYFNFSSNVCLMGELVINGTLMRTVEEIWSAKGFLDDMGSKKSHWKTRHKRNGKNKLSFRMR